MVTFIEIISGPLLGSRYKVREDLTLGRAKADIIIKDSKISGTHAQIKRDGKQRFILVDLNSSNGLFIGGRRVKKVALFQDVIFEIGRTQFKVIETTETEAAKMEVVENWREALRNRSATLTNDLQSTVYAFSPAIRLLVQQGVQADHEWIVGWGPREAGKFSNDIYISEPKLKGLAFRLTQKEHQMWIESLCDLLLLNNSPTQSSALNFGDVISLGETQIKILPVDEAQ